MLLVLREGALLPALQEVGLLPAALHVEGLLPAQHVQGLLPALHEVGLLPAALGSSGPLWMRRRCGSNQRHSGRPSEALRGHQRH